MNQPTHAQYELDPDKLRRILPTGPGVYCFKDHSGRIIYVGKAKNIKKRVLSYIRPHNDRSGKTALMVKKAVGLDVILTSTENEAFILESSLIKKNMPRYNVILRDDKQYPCLRLQINEDFPRLSVVRRMKKDNLLYFGPFSSAGAVRSTHKMIDRVFKLRKCKEAVLPNRTRPCLNFQMGRCLGPCTNKIPLSEYRDIVEQVRLFLDGRNGELIAGLKKDMAEASERLDFEKAVEIRDRIRAIEKTIERQHVVSRRQEDQDVIGLAEDRDGYQLVILFVRKGYVVGSRNHFFVVSGGSGAEVTEAFLKQYYAQEAFIPEQILISELIEDLVPIMRWLSDLADKKIVIHRPLRGEKLKLVDMAVSNAKTLVAAHSRTQGQDLTALVQSSLDLKKTPRFIEGLDISNIQGELAVGSIVSFVEGLPHKAGYRNFRINAVDGIDDYGMMVELVERRVAQGNLPDLFLVDGGKGHLSIVKSALGRLMPSEPTEVVSIAKPDISRQEKYDKIFLVDRKNPLSLRSDHPVLLLMMRIRDEAHRRAISYHRKLGKGKVTGSELERISGIGEKKRNNLLRHFGSLRSVSHASRDELIAVQGITDALAEKIIAFFKEQNG